MHVNALLPCLVVYYALAIQKNVFLAVALYDSFLVFGPILTQRLRRESTGLKAVERLGRSLTKPRKWTTCVQATGHLMCAVGFGAFSLFNNVPAASEGAGHRKSHKGRHGGTRFVCWDRRRGDAFLVFMGIWFCTVNPLVEELLLEGGISMRSSGSELRAGRVRRTCMLNWAAARFFRGRR